MFNPTKKGRYAQRSMWVPVGGLQIGMWVSGLDRPWLETPFPLQGFMVRSYKDVETLKLYCDKVELDIYKCWVKPDGYLDEKVVKSEKSRPKLIERLLFMGKDSGETQDQEHEEVELEAEIGTAKRVYSQSAATLTSIIADIRRGGTIDCVQVKTIALDMVGSILRNSDALIWLSQLRNKDDYAYQHSINVCILMLALGKHLALAPNQLAHLAVAGLLQDVGVLLLPEELIHKQGKLSPEELSLARSHVDKSLALLHNQPDMSQTVLDTIAQHHERYDGSGYPKRLKGTEISLFGSIAGITDCYDAMISDRPYAPAMSSFQALMVLYELKGRSFNPGVVERFIQSIGIYPIGSVVEMSSGEVGIVLEQRRERRLKPRLLLVLDANKKPYDAPFELDLLNDPRDIDGRMYGIKDVLGCGAYGIDAAEYYLV